MLRYLASSIKFLLFASLALSSYAQADKCLGLVLQGGGDKGAYQAGALLGIVNALGSQAQYDVISGVSVGAVNAAFISQFAKGEELEMGSKLADFWLNLDSSNLYKQWPGGIAQGLLIEPSIYNTAPSKDFFESILTEKPKRFISVGATDVNDAEYRTFKNFREDLSPQQLVQAVMASFAVPGVFPYITIDGVPYIDGGAILSMDVGSAVAKCREITGGVDENIHIDIIFLSGKNYKPENASNYNAIKMLMRAIELMSYQSSLAGLVQAQSSYPKVDFRYIIQPRKTLPDSILPMGFNHQNIKKMIEYGTEDAKDVIKKGPKVSFQEAVEAAKLHLSKGRINNDELMTQYMSEVEKLLREKFVDLEEK
jgi:predicted acylesterase/phospholipase RssA